MLTPDQACEIVTAHLQPFGDERVPLERAVGELLREPLVADRDLPPFDRVAMDGFAVNAVTFPGRGPVTGMARAGAPRARLADPAGAVEAMTGAMLPEGCDAVLPVEWIARGAGGVRLMEGRACRPGLFIHRAGSDAVAGTVVLPSGTRLLAPQVALAAALGKTEPLVARRPRVAVVTTGDEVVPAAATPLPHQIRGSNAPSLCASLRLSGFTRLAMEHLPDSADGLADGLAAAIAAADITIVVGGISAGAFDLVPAALERCGTAIMFRGVAQRPGKPLLFAVSREGRPVFGLPGNPQSCLVGLHRYVLPALFHAMGWPGQAEPVSLPLLEATACDAELTLFRLAVREAGGLRLVATPGSGDQAAPARSDGFVELRPGAGFPAGAAVPFRAWLPRW